MKDYFDVKFSELLQKSEFELPNSYEMRFQNTLEKISAKKAKRYFLLFHSKVAAVIALCVVSLSLSIGAGAAINLYIQRMNSLNEEEMLTYNSEVQNTDKEADSFSRQLSKLERDKMLEFREEYETEGRFPTKEILKVQKKSNSSLLWHPTPQGAPSTAEGRPICINSIPVRGSWNDGNKLCSFCSPSFVNLLANCGQLAGIWFDSHYLILSKAAWHPGYLRRLLSIALQKKITASLRAWHQEKET